MRFDIWLSALAFTVLAAGETLAQTSAPNSVTAHYRAYRDALAAGDSAATETHAAAALDASVARDGDGGNTAVLAINLAQARLSLGRREQAFEPAQQAYRIASSGASNVDPAMARLVLGRAQLTPERDSIGREMLEDALRETRGRTDLRADVYAAAADLGRWQSMREQYGSAFEAWTIAAESADAVDGDAAYARAEARLGAASAQTARAMEAVIREQARPTDTRFNTNAYGPLRDADQALAEAQALMAPYAHVTGEDGGLTLGQRTYANALAWRTVARAFLQSRGQRPLPAFDLNAPSTDDSSPVCPMEIVAEPRPNFPTGASSVFAVGAAVVRFNVDAQGQTTGVDVAASIPDRWFRESLERVTPQWRLARAEDAPANCQYKPVFYQTWMFYFR